MQRKQMGFFVLGFDLLSHSQWGPGRVVLLPKALAMFLQTCFGLGWAHIFYWKLLLPEVD